MVTQPMEISLLTIKKAQIVNELETLINDEELMNKIKEMAGEGVSLNTLFKRLFRSTCLVDLNARRLRNEIAGNHPQCLKLFDELVRTCKELARIDTPMIVY